MVPVKESETNTDGTVGGQASGLDIAPAPARQTVLPSLINRPVTRSGSWFFFFVHCLPASNLPLTGCTSSNTTCTTISPNTTWDNLQGSAKVCMDGVLILSSVLLALCATRYMGSTPPMYALSWQVTKHLVDLHVHTHFHPHAWNLGHLRTYARTHTMPPCVIAPRMWILVQHTHPSPTPLLGHCSTATHSHAQPTITTTMPRWHASLPRQDGLRPSSSLRQQSLRRCVGWLHLSNGPSLHCLGSCRL
jgi:hypothetical protein